MWVLMIIIVLLAIFIYIYTNILRLSLKCQGFLLEIDKLLKKELELIPSLTKIISEYYKMDSRTLNNCLEEKIGTINQKNKVIETIGLTLDKIFNNSSKIVEIDNSKLRNLDLELSKINKELNMTIDLYNTSANEYNRFISFIIISQISKLFNCKKKTLFKKG